MIDCEATTEELGQKLNFGFYRKCELIDEEYKTIEEGIIVADDLAKRFGQKAVVLLNSFDKHRADTVCGRFATIHVYARSEFVTKVFFPWAVGKNAMVVGANLAFDLSVLSVAYHETQNRKRFFAGISPSLQSVNTNVIHECPLFQRIRALLSLNYREVQGRTNAASEDVDVFWMF